MNYSGKSFRIEELQSGVVNVILDLQDSSVNKLNRATLRELLDLLRKLESESLSGVIFSSAKSSFIVGADITEFNVMFSNSEEDIVNTLREGNQMFNAVEDLPVPTVSVIDGIALGGGFELAIATDFRIGTDAAVVGFPEVKLGIIPGFGGTVRTPRLIGADNANEWISSGSHIKANRAFKEGALDAIVATDKLIEAAEKIIQQCNAGKLDYKAIRSRKTSPLTLSPVELNVAFETAKGVVAAKAGPHYPAPLAAVATMQATAGMDRSDALEVEHQAFARLARTSVSANLVQMFFNDQYLAAKAKESIANASEIGQAAVLGAGIMGGGIAYQSALKGTPIVMKDIDQKGLDLGIAEAQKQLGKQLERGRLDNNRMLDILNSISPVLDYSGFDKTDIVVEAVVENAEIKKKVLAEVEEQISDDSIIVTNTSTISVDDLATALKRPERFCGMHFFNPVPVMPLVEVIRGKQSSEPTIATTVAYAKKMGKTPIVVNNCPGFLVNRILFPYLGAFSRLIHDGADFRQIDKAMEKFGWPMGPAYLMDVVGIDTGLHAQQVMAAGFERMQLNFTSAIDKLFELGDYGQKTGKGFYLYETDKRGKPKKLPNPEIEAVIKAVQADAREFDNEEIVNRMMVPMCLETVRCLEDGIVDSPIEADMGLVLGLGFPPFRGGALRFMDEMGLDKFCELADGLTELGSMYEPTEKLREMAAAGQTYYR